MSSTVQNFQYTFLKRLQKRFSTRAEMVQALGETLNVGRDAIYRRLRSDTVLTADELVLLSRTYNMPIDVQRDLSGVPTMQYHQGKDQINNELQYFEGLLRHTTAIAAMPNARVDYATPELPIFYELEPPTLRAFKVFIYGATTWSLKKWDKLSFAPNLISPEVNRVIDGIIENSYNVAGRELWSIGILDVTLRQINYMAEIGRFADKKYLIAIFDELHEVINHLERMAKAGKRFHPGTEPQETDSNFSVYHNELSNTNNAIIINSDQGRMMFSTLINPNYLTTTDPRILDDTSRWFERLVSQSNSLGSASAKYTNQYFGRLRQQIEAARDRVAYANVIF